MNRKFPVPSDRTISVAKVLLVLVLTATLGWLLFSVLSMSRQAEASRQETSELAKAVRAQDEALAKANGRLVQNGEKPVATPDTPSTSSLGPRGLMGPPGPIGPMGPMGLRGIMGVQGNQGAQGDQGAAGASITGPEGSSGATGPQGPPGAPGRDGADGKNGQDGAPGRDGTDAFPFTFTFTVPGLPTQDNTYTVTCTGPSACSTVSQ